MADLDFPLPAPISDPKKHHARGQNRSGARPSVACAGGGHSLDLLKAKMLFLEGKYAQDIFDKLRSDFITEIDAAHW